MVELALVLFLKQKQEWVKNMDKVSSHDVKSEDNIFKKIAVVANDIDKGTPAQEIEHNIDVPKDQKEKSWMFYGRMLSIYHSLPLTTKIDVATFLLFYLFFFLANCIYWPIAADKITK